MNSQNEMVGCGIATIERKRLGPRLSHINSRSKLYDNQIERFPVPDDKIAWEMNFPEYKPIEFTTEKIKNNKKADPIDP